MVTHCPCSRTLLSTLTDSPRRSCEDPIPTCHNVCGKPLDGCSHLCQRLCHSGPCGDCDEQVNVVCRCGNEKRRMRCSDLTKMRMSGEGDAEITCQRVCRAMRHCGKHVCARKVSLFVGCSLSWKPITETFTRLLVLSTCVSRSLQEGEASSAGDLAGRYRPARYPQLRPNL
jgi:transcriptional repressor NF-X1